MRSCFLHDPNSFLAASSAWLGIKPPKLHNLLHSTSESSLFWGDAPEISSTESVCSEPLEPSLSISMYSHGEDNLAASASLPVLSTLEPAVQEKTKRESNVQKKAASKTFLKAGEGEARIKLVAEENMSKKERLQHEPVTIYKASTQNKATASKMRRRFYGDGSLGLPGLPGGAGHSVPIGHADRSLVNAAKKVGYDLFGHKKKKAKKEVSFKRSARDSLAALDMFSNSVGSLKSPQASIESSDWGSGSDIDVVSIKESHESFTIPEEFRLMIMLLKFNTQKKLKSPREQLPSF